MAYALGCDGPTCATAAGLAAVSVRIALIDLKLRIIQDRDVIALAAIGLTWITWSAVDPVFDLILVLLRGFGYTATFEGIRLIYRQVRGRDGLGLGDVKLAGAAGPLLTIQEFAFAVAVASISGIVFALLRNFCSRRPRSRYSYIPLGCFLSFAIYASWLFGAVQP